MSKMMRITDETASHLDNLQKILGESKRLLLERAVKQLSREYFLKKSSDAYAQLNKNSESLQEYEAELELWDATLLDELENE